MPTTLDIPDPMHRVLNSKAAQEGKSVKAIVLRSVENELGLRKIKTGKGVKLPIVRSKRPGWLNNRQCKDCGACSFSLISTFGWRLRSLHIYTTSLLVDGSMYSFQ